MPQSAGRLWPPCVLRQPPVNAFEKIAELRRRHRYCPIRRRWPDEATALQPLREQAHALAIVPQHLDQAAKPNDIQHTDRNLLSSSTHGTRCMASDCASISAQDVAASKSYTSKCVAASPVRFRHG